MDMQQTLQPGATVYGADGEKVGKMSTFGGTYLVVEKGFFFPKDYYIPLSAVAEANGDSVYLTVTKDEALNQGWDEMPADALTTSDQMGGGTMYADQDTGATYANQGTSTSYADQDSLTVPVHEEHLQAYKRQADAGDVTISKQVVTEQETIQVPVTEERVRVEWREPTGEVNADGAVFEEGTVEIPVSREEVQVSKQAVQTGEVQVTKERQQRTQQVTDSVRREVVDVEDTTDGTLGGAR
jgi:uncharacterized protein (TIGR02271 family)